MQSREAQPGKGHVQSIEQANGEQLIEESLTAQSAQRLQMQGGETAGKWAVLAIVAIGVFMATLDSSIVNISLPTIAHNFGVPLSGAVEWVIIAYLVTTAAILLTSGRLADMVGRKVVWTVGLIVFTTSSAVCGLAPSLGILIASRAVQGLGGALLMSISPAMLTNAFPANERGRALGFNTITVALGISTGPILGGIITASISWRWIFYVNVPSGIIGLIATLLILKERLHRNPGRFDPLGAVLIAIGMAGLTAGLSFGQEIGWTSPVILTLLIVGGVALIALPFVEQHVRNPIIALELLYNRVFNSAILSLLLSFLALTAIGFMMPFYFEQLRGFSTVLSGILLTPVPLMLALIAPFSGRLSDRIGSRWLAASGLTIACVGLVLISQLNEHSSIFDIIWRLVFTSFGQGLFQTPNGSALLGAAPRHLQGSASGFLATGRTIGQSLSVAIAGAVFAGVGGAAAGNMIVLHINAMQLSTYQQIFDRAFQTTFLVCACIAAIGIFASLVRGNAEKLGIRTE